MNTIWTLVPATPSDMDWMIIVTVRVTIYLKIPVKTWRAGTDMTVFWGFRTKDGTIRGGEQRDKTWTRHTRTWVVSHDDDRWPANCGRAQKVCLVTGSVTGDHRLQCWMQIKTGHFRTFPFLFQHFLSVFSAPRARHFDRWDCVECCGSEEAAPWDSSVYKTVSECHEPGACVWSPALVSRWRYCDHPCCCCWWPSAITPVLWCSHATVPAHTRPSYSCTTTCPGHGDMVRQETGCRVWQW